MWVSSFFQFVLEYGLTLRHSNWLPHGFPFLHISMSSRIWSTIVFPYELSLPALRLTHTCNPLHSVSCPVSSSWSQSLYNLLLGCSRAGFVLCSCSNGIKRIAASPVSVSWLSDPTLSAHGLYLVYRVTTLYKLEDKVCEGKDHFTCCFYDAHSSPAYQYTRAW